MTNEIKIQPAEGVQTLILREGAAEEIEKPAIVNVTGTITAPSLFLARREGQLDVKKSYVVVSRKRGTITLIVDEKDPRGTKIAGELKIRSELFKLGINIGVPETVKKYGTKELATFIHMNRLFFANEEERKTLEDKLQKFNLRIETELKDQDDRKGNTLWQIATKLTHEIPLNFTMQSEIFEGQPKESFRVDIAVEVISNGASFWFESPDLAELIQKRRDEILDKELSYFAKYVIMEVL